MSAQPLLTINNLHVTVDEQTPVIKGINLAVQSGQVHAIMGPNGSGKSSLAKTIMGHPSYEVTNGSITFDGMDCADLSIDKRAKAGIFLAFQYPYEVQGVPLRDFLRQSYNALWGGTERQIGIKAFRELVASKCALLGIPEEFLDRALNVGFSGGEKKRAEMLQLAVLQPKLAILDEIDSGLDIDALRIVCSSLKKIMADNPSMALIVVTHYQRILQHLTPDFVHVMEVGKLTRSGGPELALQLEREGYRMKEAV